MIKKGLGKGLSALIPEAAETESGALMIDINKISPGAAQPRLTFDDIKLAELAESIKNLGVVQPLIVVNKDGGYELVAGERRYRAAMLAGLSAVPCVVREGGDTDLAEIALIENIQREDLNAAEEAAALQSLMQKAGYTQAQLAERLGKSRSHIANTLRLLTLDPDCLQMLAEGRLSAGHARALAVLPPLVQRSLARKIVLNGLSVRAAEDLARNATEEIKPKTASPEKPARDPVYTEIERRLMRVLGSKVSIGQKTKGGSINIEYYNDEDLNRLLEMLLPGEDF